eukprot:5346918-Prymnesium_polylepis.1
MHMQAGQGPSPRREVACRIVKPCRKTLTPRGAPLLSRGVRSVRVLGGSRSTRPSDSKMPGGASEHEHTEVATPNDQSEGRRTR